MIKKSSSETEFCLDYNNYSFILPTCSGGAIPCCDVFGEGVGDVHIHDVRCVDSETNITGCTYRNNTGYKTHQHDVGVQCQQG